MNLDFGNGGRPVDTLCAEVSAGVFERKFAKITVRLDCNTWEAGFAPSENLNVAEGQEGGREGGYGGRGMSLPE